MLDKLGQLTNLFRSAAPTGATDRPAGASGGGLMRLLAAQLGSRPESAVTGRVEEVRTATTEQRQRLLSRLMEAISHWQTRPDSPRRNEQLARLNAERALIDSPLLKLVRVQVQRESIVTFTDRPLRPGQSLPLYLSSGRLWQMAESSPQARMTVRSSTPQNMPGSAIDSGSQWRSEAPQRPTPPAVAEALRRALPLTDQPDLAPLLNRFEALTSRQQSALVERSVQESLQQAARQLRSPTQLTQPEALRRALSESGTLLERRLAESLRLTPQTGRLPGQTDTVQRPAGAEADRAGAAARILANDWKGALLRVLSSTRAALDGAGQRPDPTLANELNLTGLLQQAGARPAPDTPDPSLRSQLLQRVHQLTLASLARVQLAQGQTLAQQTPGAEAAQSQPVTLELPLRLGSEITPLWLRIDPETDAEEDSRTDPESRVRQWQVQLNFDLPGAGPLHASLTVRNEQVATRLWAERPATAETIKHRLAQLQERFERDGIEVTRLECHTGAPPHSGTGIRYSLVDIQT